MTLLDRQEASMVADEGRRECDLVMKGGITSGIVYPKAVLALKDTYTFRNIGGTSAGAIAAVATRRRSSGATDGCERKRWFRPA